MGPEAIPGHLSGGKIIEISRFFDNFVNIITSNAIDSSEYKNIFGFSTLEVVFGIQLNLILPESASGGDRNYAGAIQ